MGVGPRLQPISELLGADQPIGRLHLGQHLHRPGPLHAVGQAHPPELQAAAAPLRSLQVLQLPALRSVGRPGHAHAPRHPQRLQAHLRAFGLLRLPFLLQPVALGRVLFCGDVGGAAGGIGRGVEVAQEVGGVEQAHGPAAAITDDEGAVGMAVEEDDGVEEPIVVLAGEQGLVDRAIDRGVGAAQVRRDRLGFEGGDGDPILHHDHGIFRRLGEAVLEGERLEGAAHQRCHRLIAPVHGKRPCCSSVREGKVVPQQRVGP